MSSRPKEVGCIVSGTFDPLTVGHKDIICRAAAMFDVVHILIAKTSSKPGHLLTYEEKVFDIESSVNASNIKIHPIEGALVDQAKKLGVNVIVRGLRNEQDLVYEMDMSSVNRILNSEIETVYLPCKPELSFVSSSMVREMCRLGKFEEASKFASHNAVMMMKSHLNTVVALTGGIACGKSEVQKIFSENSWATIDCDEINRSHVLGSTIHCEKIKDAMRHLGHNVTNDFGFLSLDKLREVVFSDKDAREKLNEIAWPVILEVVNAFCSDWSWNPSTKIAVQVPLLFEPGSEEFSKVFSKTVCLTSPAKLQVERMMTNRKLSLEEATARLKSQMDVYEKAKLCDFEIENSGSLEDLRKKTLEVIEKL